MKPTTLAFDVYGTLIDTHGVVTALADIIGADAAAFSHTWRDKQLEYSFRRGLMQHYDSFAVCTANALDYACAAHAAALNDEQKAMLIASYSRLPPFADVKAGLVQLQGASHRLFAFSNGSRAAVDTLLANAGVRDLFIDIVSVDEIKTFKPSPAVYHHFLRRANTDASQAWLVSSNPFDVIGASVAGMKTVWLKRASGAVFDPWGIQPTATLPSLADLPALL